MQKLAYTTQELAEVIGFSARQLAAWRKEGSGPPFFKLGGKICYPRQQVVAWLAQQCDAAGADQLASEPTDQLVSEPSNELAEPSASDAVKMALDIARGSQHENQTHQMASTEGSHAAVV